VQKNKYCNGTTFCITKCHNIFAF